ncbi:MAG: UDP-3-O-(3-hydroxymyristoyl)glucosamine N-acyltransferase [Paracoccaceae bacterium]
MSSYTISEIAKALSARSVGDGGILISAASEPANAGADQLAVAMDPRYADGIAKGRARAAIMWQDADWESFGLEAAILVDRPRLAMAALTTHLEGAQAENSAVHSAAIIDPSVQLGDDVSIGPFVVIEANVVISDRVRIAPHCCVGNSSTIGSDSVLQSGVLIGPQVRIGARFMSHPGVVIGADGFSFVTADDSSANSERETLKAAPAIKGGQSWLKIHSLGGVQIGDDVEIGANSTIDAGTIRPTFIGNGTKIDALFNVAHNVRIGSNCLLCGQAGMGGSATLGNAVILGGQAGVADNIRVGDGVIAGGASKIYSNVPAGRTILGNPATKIETQIEIYKAMRRLPQHVREITRLKILVSKTRDNN